MARLNLRSVAPVLDPTNIKLSPHWSLRAAEVDYVLTTIHTAHPTDFLVVSTRHNNFREVSGMIFTW
jgi:hypothetical protein